MNNSNFNSIELANVWESVVSDFRQYKPLTVSDVSRDIISLESNLRNEGVEVEFRFDIQTLYSPYFSTFETIGGEVETNIPISRYLSWEKYGDKKTSQYRIIYRSEIGKPLTVEGNREDDKYLDSHDIEEKRLKNKFFAEFPELHLLHEQCCKDQSNLDQNREGLSESERQEMFFRDMDLQDEIRIRLKDFYDLSKEKSLFLFNAPLDDMPTEIRMRVYPHLPSFVKWIASNWKANGYRKSKETLETHLITKPSMFFIEKSLKEKGHNLI